MNEKEPKNLVFSVEEKIFNVKEDKLIAVKLKSNEARFIIPAVLIVGLFLIFTIYGIVTFETPLKNVVCENDEFQYVFEGDRNVAIIRCISGKPNYLKLRKYENTFVGGKEFILITIKTVDDSGKLAYPTDSDAQRLVSNDEYETVYRYLYYDFEERQLFWYYGVEDIDTIKKSDNYLEYVMLDVEDNYSIIEKYIIENEKQYIVTIQKAYDNDLKQEGDVFDVLIIETEYDTSARKVFVGEYYISEDNYGLTPEEMVAIVKDIDPNYFVTSKYDGDSEYSFEQYFKAEDEEITKKYDIYKSGKYVYKILID